MERNKLISMVEFTKNVRETSGDPNPSNNFKDCLSYAKFLSQPLALWMFVACDSEGQPFYEPQEKNFTDEACFVNNAYFMEHFEWQQAKERVLFEGFDIQNSKIFGEYDKKYLAYKTGGRFADLNPFKPTLWLGGHTFTTVESLIVGYKDLTLTPQAVKQIYGN